jgi:hypothetical protein
METHTLTNLRTVLLLAAAAGLSACAAHEPEKMRPDLGATPEKLLLAGLDKVTATDAQRVAVLTAYDNRQEQLTDLAKRSRQIVSDWHKLDRTAPDYSAKVEALAQQWGQLNGDEMRARSAYEHDVASTLDAGQWKRWQSFMDDVTAARRRAYLTDYDNPDGRRGR